MGGRGTTHNDVWQRQTKPPPQPRQEGVVNVRLVARHDDQRLAVLGRSGSDLLQLIKGKNKSEEKKLKGQKRWTIER